MAGHETDPHHRVWTDERGSAELTRVRPGVGLIVMRGRIEGECAQYVIDSLPWLCDGQQTDTYWDLATVTSFSLAVPPTMVNGMIKHRALVGKLHMYTLSALLKATIVGSNLTLGGTMIHYGEQDKFEAALAEASR